MLSTILFLSTQKPIHRVIKSLHFPCNENDYHYNKETRNPRGENNTMLRNKWWWVMVMVLVGRKNMVCQWGNVVGREQHVEGQAIKEVLLSPHFITFHSGLRWKWKRTFIPLVIKASKSKSSSAFYFSLASLSCYDDNSICLSSFPHLLPN